jgi:hypothetical protein
VKAGYRQGNIACSDDAMRVLHSTPKKGFWRMQDSSLHLRKSMHAEIESADLKTAVSDFMRVYTQRPILTNTGGMRFNHSFATWFILRSLKPSTVIESGVLRGHSTWLIEQACPAVKVYCLDPNFSNLFYRSSTATYIKKDFAECGWQDIDCASTVCFFDDHQNAYQRMKDMLWAGFTQAIFDDNFPYGEGDCYTLKHMLGCFGHPHLQMSKAYLGKWHQRWRRWYLERVLRSFGPRQQLIVPPNTSDRCLFGRNCKEYFEFPPVALRNVSQWGAPYQGAYKVKNPIYPEGDLPPQLSKLMAWDGDEFHYSYIAYVELNSCADA